MGPKLVSHAKQGENAHEGCLSAAQPALMLVQRRKKQRQLGRAQGGSSSYSTGCHRVRTADVRRVGSDAVGGIRAVQLRHKLGELRL
jgi:hypothetical protein